MPSSFGSNRHRRSSNALAAALGEHRLEPRRRGDQRRVLRAREERQPVGPRLHEVELQPRVPAAVEPEAHLRVGPLDRLVPAVVEDPDLAGAVVPLGDRPFERSVLERVDLGLARRVRLSPLLVGRPFGHRPRRQRRPRARAARRSAAASPGACGSRTSCPSPACSPGAGSVVPASPNSRLRTYSNRFGSFDARTISSEVFRVDGRAAVRGSGRALGRPPRARRRARRTRPSRSSTGPSRTPANRSPTPSNRSQTLSIRKSWGSNPPSSTSSHVSGVETGARGSGRSEYAAAMFAPCRFMLWSMKTFPARSATRHAIVTRSGSALAINRPHAPTNARTWP